MKNFNNKIYYKNIMNVEYNNSIDKLPNELFYNIFYLANNRCSTCNYICIVPYKKISKFYYCCKTCYFHF